MSVVWLREIRTAGGTLDRSVGAFFPARPSAKVRGPPAKCSRAEQAYSVGDCSSVRCSRRMRKKGGKGGEKTEKRVPIGIRVFWEDKSLGLGPREGVDRLTRQRREEKASFARVGTV